MMTSDCSKECGKGCGPLLELNQLYDLIEHRCYRHDRPVALSVSPEKTLHPSARSRWYRRQNAGSSMLKAIIIDTSCGRSFMSRALAAFSSINFSCRGTVARVRRVRRGSCSSRSLAEPV